MNTIQLKTNIMCSSCIEKVTPVLNEELGAENWKVDTTNPKKILTVESNTLNEEELVKIVEKTGYKASKLD